MFNALLSPFSSWCWVRESKPRTTDTKQSVTTGIKDRSIRILPSVTSPNWPTQLAMKGLSNNSSMGFLGLSKVLRRWRLGLPDAKDRGGRDGWLCGGFILCRGLSVRVCVWVASVQRVAGGSGAAFSLVRPKRRFWQSQVSKLWQMPPWVDFLECQNDFQQFGNNTVVSFPSVARLVSSSTTKQINP